MTVSSQGGVYTPKKGAIWFATILGGDVVSRSKEDFSPTPQECFYMSRGFKTYGGEEIGAARHLPL